VDISDKAYKNAWTLLSLGKSNYFDIQNALNTSINAQRQWLQLKRRLDVTNANLQVFIRCDSKDEYKSSSLQNLNMLIFRDPKLLDQIHQICWRKKPAVFRNPFKNPICSSLEILEGIKKLKRKQG
jgi:hypothetical protein